ncbi:unnamed protein product [Didymodactylos carnosus]|uniref:Uncharacterized protein n=1 Tax=Didymodactylos carnosus TaxID=1234261 RepID=A0A813QTU8_9BILA|nr:unnamed protein product [Didymodactylos carnosus]CAF0927388.1 unnamed protein product [Didymodactylos carnosus]CAF3555146.1 unnamed protein product [Didymodactylos carnosus]CAF3704285.1 unnamed protein product [Didymodactylos carnosus]
MNNNEITNDQPLLLRKSKTTYTNLNTNQTDYIRENNKQQQQQQSTDSNINSSTSSSIASSNDSQTQAYQQHDNDSLLTFVNKLYCSPSSSILKMNNLLGNNTNLYDGNEQHHEPVITTNIIENMLTIPTISTPDILDVNNVLDDITTNEEHSDEDDNEVAQYNKFGMYRAVLGRVTTKVDDHEHAETGVKSGGYEFHYDVDNPLEISCSVSLSSADTISEHTQSPNNRLSTIVNIDGNTLKGLKLNTNRQKILQRTNDKKLIVENENEGDIMKEAMMTRLCLTSDEELNNSNSNSNDDNDNDESDDSNNLKSEPLEKLDYLKNNRKDDHQRNKIKRTNTNDIQEQDEKLRSFRGWHMSMLKQIDEKLKEIEFGETDSDNVNNDEEMCLHSDDSLSSSPRVHNFYKRTSTKTHPIKKSYPHMKNLSKTSSSYKSPVKHASDWLPIKNVEYIRNKNNRHIPESGPSLSKVNRLENRKHSRSPPLVSQLNRFRTTPKHNRTTERISRSPSVEKESKTLIINLPPSDDEREEKNDNYYHKSKMYYRPLRNKEQLPSTMTDSQMVEFSSEMDNNYVKKMQNIYQNKAKAKFQSNRLNEVPDHLEKLYGHEKKKQPDHYVQTVQNGKKHDKHFYREQLPQYNDDSSRTLYKSSTDFSHTLHLNDKHSNVRRSSYEDEISLGKRFPSQHQSEDEQEENGQHTREQSTERRLRDQSAQTDSPSQNSTTDFQALLNNWQKLMSTSVNSTSAKTNDTHQSQPSNIEKRTNSTYNLDQISNYEKTRITRENIRSNQNRQLRNDTLQNGLIVEYEKKHTGYSNKSDGQNIPQSKPNVSTKNMNNTNGSGAQFDLNSTKLNNPNVLSLTRKNGTRFIQNTLNNNNRDESLNIVDHNQPRLSRPIDQIKFFSLRSKSAASGRPDLIFGGPFTPEPHIYNAQDYPQTPISDNSQQSYSNTSLKTAPRRASLEQQLDNYGNRVSIARDPAIYSADIGQITAMDTSNLGHLVDLVFDDLHDHNSNNFYRDYKQLLDDIQTRFSMITTPNSDVSGNHMNEKEQQNNFINPSVNIKNEYSIRQPVFLEVANVIKQPTLCDTLIYIPSSR